jgi:menaquinone-dependent protoporphyrinogen oxidase
MDAECRAVLRVNGLKPYDAVVLGSAVYFKRWRGEARRFLRRHADELAALPFWIFSSGPVGSPEEDPDPKWLEPSKLVAEAERLSVRAHVVFGGRLPDEHAGVTARALTRNIPAAFHDRRDWNEIDAWARSITAQLQATATEGALKPSISP